MSALLNEDERALRDAVRSFLDKKVAPLVAGHERARTFPWDLLPQLYDFGYVRGGVPEAAGGDELPMMMQAILMEEAGRCWGRCGPPSTCRAWWPGCSARPPTPARRNGSWSRCCRAPVRLVRADRARRRLGRRGAADHRPTTGDGFVVNGSKLYITNALGCDFGILFARVVDEDGTDHGVTGLLVDAAESQFGVHDIPHMPLRSTTSCELTFDDTFVPAGNVLGKLGGGLSLGMAAVNAGRLNMAMGAVGLSQACLEESVRFCRQREQFGKPIAAFQLVQQMVVEIATLTETSRLLGYHAARTIDAGQPGRYECSMAKYYCGESAGRAATLALQVHGGAGLMEESPVERYFRDAREATIPEGTSQIQILHLGKALLGHSALR